MIKAATNVSSHLSVSRTVAPENVVLLKALAAGQRVIDIAADRGWSERHLYRELSNLWSDLGVKNRQQGIALAAENGWLN